MLYISLILLAWRPCKIHWSYLLDQRAGYTVQAERLNFLRFLSHFRAVHRGASFAGLRTTTVRKLLPELVHFYLISRSHDLVIICIHKYTYSIIYEPCVFLLNRSWGFLCPVHTPDGEPCGLLNHMTCTCSKLFLFFLLFLFHLSSPFEFCEKKMQVLHVCRFLVLIVHKILLLHLHSLGIAFWTNFKWMLFYR